MKNKILSLVLWLALCGAAASGQIVSGPTPSAGSGVVDGQQLYDGSHVLSLDAGTRLIVADDGSSPQIDYSVLGQLTFVNQPDYKVDSDGFHGVFTGTFNVTATFNTNGNTIITGAGNLQCAGNVAFTSLPTSDPGVTGRLWNDGGILKISP